MSYKKWLILGVVGALIVVTVLLKYVSFDNNSESKSSGEELKQKQELLAVHSVEQIQDQYDLVVIGTDPEGITAAISGARNGLKTLLIEGRNRDILGGLMTVGWLNSLDMNWDRSASKQLGKPPEYLNKGIFSEWYQKIEGDSFDVTTAANAFYELVKSENNIDLYMKATAIEPLVKKEKDSTLVQGISFKKSDGTVHNVLAKSVVDATQDADIAAAAGGSFTIGREDLGDEKSRMAVTAVFRLKNIDDKAWNLIQKRMKDTKDTGSGSNKMSAWGYGKEMQDYVPVNKERTKMRGLNIGRQMDGTILINALQIFGVDGMNPKSVQEGMEIAKKEIPHVIEFLKKFEEFKRVELTGIAPELYVRETRHMNGLYRLNVIDLLENRDQWDRIAFGSYPADIQRTSPTDNGAVVVHPSKYAVPFRSIVPNNLDGILVVGRSASYDTLAHGSARVIPTGMAEGQAAGAAVKLSIEQGISFRKMADTKSVITELQNRLNEQGMEINSYTPSPQSFMNHKAYEGLKAAVYMGIAVGSYNNETFKLDKTSNPQRLVNALYTIQKKYHTQFTGDFSTAVENISEPAKQPLTLKQACYTIAVAAGLDSSLETAQEDLFKKGLLTKSTQSIIADPKALTDGDMYLLLKDAVEGLAGTIMK
ncbi:FAD-dependent oxidoreductase [Paenibacillus sp. N1-5-1-14]|uniref:FAD-dependent oxidoreductase n=1 Tax=Paenibacillus radicibacter TaxID=2972488 RepID=UPI002158F365|nr:FAD-dependent oxidoreductase [Paenibacillus radicibacter]MCR8644273.1 FAD-dependent oxidoreductase [Paenibacillus radicibacter]